MYAKSNRMSGSLSQKNGSPPYFYFRFGGYSPRLGLFWPMWPTCTSQGGPSHTTPSHYVLVATGVNPAGDAVDTSPNILVGGGRQREYPQYYYVLSDIADQYWLPCVRSASSRFHSAIRRHQFASVRQADSRLTLRQCMVSATRPAFLLLQSASVLHVIQTGSLADSL